LRPLNFGFQALTQPLHPTTFASIARYNAGDAAIVSQMLRSSAGLKPTIAALIENYRTVIAEHGQNCQTRIPSISWTSRFHLLRGELAARLVLMWRELNNGRGYKLALILEFKPRAAVRWVLFNPKSR
jgi:hypothetical protein